MTNQVKEEVEQKIHGEVDFTPILQGEANAGSSKTKKRRRGGGCSGPAMSPWGLAFGFIFWRRRQVWDRV